MRNDVGLLNKPNIIYEERKFVITETDVVVFLLWHLGDALNSTALLPELAARHNRKLVFATTEQCVPILENNPYLDTILVLDMEIPKHVSLGDWVKLQRLPQKYLPQNSTVYNLHIPINLRQTHLHIVECWAKTLGIEKPLSELKQTYFTRQSQSHKFRRGNVLILGNGGITSQWSKHWPMERWGTFIKKIKARFPELQLVQLGTENDPLLRGVEDLRGKTNIEESYHLLKLSKGCITNDSFLAHLAAASECPVFVIFGPTSPAHFRPLGNGNIFTLGGHRYYAPCSRNLCRLTLGLIPCLAFPSVKEVFAKVETILVREKI